MGDAPQVPEMKAQLTEEEKRAAFISRCPEREPALVREWLERHPNGQMCSSDYCRCKQ